MRVEWVNCPICQNKTRLKIREDTDACAMGMSSALKRYALYAAIPTENAQEYAMQKKELRPRRLKQHNTLVTNLKKLVLFTCRYCK